MAESEKDKFTKAARNQEYPLRLFQKNRTETWIYNLNCLKLQCQSEPCQFDKIRRMKVDIGSSMNQYRKLT